MLSATEGPYYIYICIEPMIHISFNPELCIGKIPSAIYIYASARLVIYIICIRQD